MSEAVGVTEMIYFNHHLVRSSLINQVSPNMLSAMASPIARKLAAFVVALTLMVGGVPAAMAAAGTSDCGMAMDSMDMQASTAQDQHSMAMTMPMPPQKQKTPCKDMAGFCAATCGGAIDLAQVGYSPVLAGMRAVSTWPAQAELASVFSRPDLPPPIAIL